MSSTRPIKRRHVARHVLNVLQLPPPTVRWYCFTTRREGPPEGSWLVTAECVSANWVDAVWRDFVRTDIGAHVHTATNGMRFADFVARSGDIGQSAIGWSWRWFLGQHDLIRADFPLEMMALELVHEPASPWTIDLTEWYEIRLAPLSPGSTAVHCFQTVLFESDDEDEDAPFQLDPVEMTIAAVHPVDSLTDGTAITRAGLHIFHTLEGLGAPDPIVGGGGGDGGEPVPTPVAPSWMESGPPLIEGFARGMVDGVLPGVMSRLRELWRDWVRGFAPFALTAGPFGMAMPIPDARDRPVEARPLEYCASPAAGGAAQMPNTVEGGRVAVLDVGQGNCNAIYDNAGNIVAYYDMGWPWGTMQASRPDAPGGVLTQTRPCVCQRPLVILSHRDLDHYRRALLRRGPCSLTWLIPAGGAQALVDGHGPYMNTLIRRIRKHGGEIVRWQNAAPQPGYMAFPWGFVERCTGTSVNSSGLAAFVCLREDPAVTLARAAIAAVPAEVVFGTPVNTQLFAAVTAATAGGGAAALAAAGAVNAAGIARAAVRAVLSIAAGAANAGAATADVNSANAFGIAMPAVAAAIPPAVATDVGNAAWAAVVAGAGATDAVRCAATAAAVPGLNAGVLVNIVAPVAAAGNVGLIRERGNRSTHERNAVAAVALNLPGGAPPNTQVFAEPVAAALARAAGVGVGWNVIAIAALRAVITVLNGMLVPATIATRINNAHALGCGAPNIAGTPLGAVLAGQTAQAALATALAGAGAANRHARDLAAANAYHIRVEPVTAAQDPARPFTVRPGRAPFSPGERYALLNGDADFHAIPSVQPLAPGNTLPMIVAMTAMHHGSFIEDGRFIESGRIPWAPGSAIGAQAAAANAAPQSLAESIRAVTDHLLGVPMVNLKADLVHAGAAAASAIYAVDADLVAAGNLAAAGQLVGQYAAAFASSAASAVVSVRNGANEAGEIALAAVHAAATRIGAAYTRDFAQAAHAARVEIRGNGLLFDESFADSIVSAAVTPGNAAALAVAANVPAFAPANTQAAAEAVAAVASTFANRPAPMIALAAVRITISTINGNGIAAAANDAYSAGGLGCGCAAMAAATARQRIAGIDLTDMATWAAAIVPRVAAITVGRAAAAAVGPVGALMVTGGGIFVFGATRIAEMLAAAWAMADRAGLAPATIAQAAMRAVIAAWTGATAGAVAAGINAANTTFGPGLTYVNTLAGIGAGPIPANVAAAIGQATFNVWNARGGGSLLARRVEAREAAGSLNQAVARRIQNAVAAVQQPLATIAVSLPGFFIATAGAAAINAANIQHATANSAAFQPEGFTNPTLDPTHRLMVSRIARTAHAGVAAVAGIGNECTAAEPALGQPVANVVNVSAVMALPASAPWANTLAGTARMASYFAMIGEAERLSGLEGADIAAAVEAVMRDTVAAATAATNVGGGLGGGALAYSYGIMPPNHHCYTNSSTLGGLGHPHPLAVAEYVARGWTRRHNTSIRANHGGPQGDAVSPRGHAALEWNHAADTATAVGNVQVACAICNQTIRIEH